MEYVVKGRNFEVDEKIKSYADRKIRDRVGRLLDKVVKVEVKFNFEKNPRINENNHVEVTVFASGAVIRATDSGSDVYSAVDRVSAKLERQVKKFRGKLLKRGRKSPATVTGPASPVLQDTMSSDTGSIEEKIRSSIVKVKSFSLKPISPEEAVIQMELLGHDFFVFINSETGQTAVVYRRKDKNYGLIEPTA
ncbi:MAG: ribosome-associated translation inhibitor RaiA [Actinobacteria bacterium]|nr:ribosome-associated translation inhibitor RaiA [Actinomycetota bacterium]